MLIDKELSRVLYELSQHRAVLFNPLCRFRVVSKPSLCKLSRPVGNVPTVGVPRAGMLVVRAKDVFASVKNAEYIVKILFFHVFKELYRPSQIRSRYTQWAVIEVMNNRGTNHRIAINPYRPYPVVKSGHLHPARAASHIHHRRDAKLVFNEQQRSYIRIGHIFVTADSPHLCPRHRLWRAVSVQLPVPRPKNR